MRRYSLLAALAVFLLAGPAAAQYPRGYTDYGRIDANGLVNDWYQRFLGRPAEPASAAWVEMLRAGNPPEEVLAGILGSPEYYMRSGGTPEGYVQKLFSDLTGRRPSREQFHYWVRRLYTADRQEVAHEVLSRYPGTWRGGRGGYDEDEHDYRRPHYPYLRDRRGP